MTSNNNNNNINSKKQTALPFDFSELQKAATQQSQKYVQSKVLEQVEWDINLRPMAQRMQPYEYEIKQNKTNNNNDGNNNNVVDTIIIHQEIGPTGEPGKAESGTGSALWTAAVGLARYLEYQYNTTTGSSSSNNSLQNKKVLELGCGTGLVSIVMAYLGATVIATDIQTCLDDHTIPNINRNCEIINMKGGTVQAKELLWGKNSTSNTIDEFGSDWDMVVASDVIYRVEHVEILFETLIDIIGLTTNCYIAFDKRGREGIKKFLQLCSSDSSPFVMTYISPKDMPDGFRFTHFGLIQLKRKTMTTTRPRA